MSAQNTMYIPAELKKSRSANIAVIYGIFACVFMIFIPFLPFKEKSLIWYGINIEQGESLIVISVLFSLIFLIAGITTIVKFKKYGNGALYSLHKFYSFYAFFYFTLYFISVFTFGSSTIEAYIYFAVDYYLIPSIVAFAIGFVFMQVAQYMNKCLHIGAAKTGYAVLSLLIGAGMSLWIYLIFDTDESFLFITSYSRAEVIIFYYMLFAVSIFFTMKRLTYLALPVNDCFEGMFFNANGNSFNKSYDSEISYWENFIVFTVYLISLVYLLICELNLMPTALGFGLVFIIGLTAWSVFYNTHIRKIKFAESEKFKEAKAAETAVSSSDSNDDAAVDEKLSVSVSYLKDKNERVKDCTVKPKTFVSGFIQKLLRNRLFISEEDAETLFTAMASSRIVFVKGISDAMSAEFMEALAGAFETDAFIDKYYQTLKGEPQEGTPEFDYANEVNRKKGVANGIFAANYLTHFIQPVFFKTTAETLGEYRLRLLKSVARGEVFRAGTQEELTKNDVYYGGNVKVTDNLWVIVLADDDAIAALRDEEVIKHSSVIEITSFSSNVDEAVSTGGGEIQEFLSYEGITDNLDEVLDLYYLTEENWRKIDALSKCVNIEIDDNKFVREIEIASSLTLFFGKSQEDALDLVVSGRVIPFFTSQPEKLVKDIEWRKTIDEVFGIEGFANTRKVAALLDVNRKKRGVKDDE